MVGPDQGPGDPDDAGFEDEHTAVAAEVVVTRNPDNFRDGPLTPYRLEEVLDALR